MGTTKGIEYSTFRGGGGNVSPIYVKQKSDNSLFEHEQLVEFLQILFNVLVYKYIISSRN